MSFKRLFLLVMIVMALGIVSVQISAQFNVEEECALLVLDALESVDEFCSVVDDNSACYAHTRVDYEAIDGVDVTFSTAGDQVALSDVQSISTAPVNVELGEWGIAVLNTTDVDDEAEDDEEIDDRTTFMMLGDVTMTNLTADEADQPQAYTFRTAGGESDCIGAPDKLVIQNPEGVVTEMSMNGLEITMESGATIVLDAIPYDEMSLLVVTGEVIVASLDETQVVIAGEMIVVTLGGDTGLIVVSIPGTPIVFDPNLIQFIPFQFVLETVEIPSADRWTATGIELTAGQAYTVIASQLVKTIDYMPWASPEGHSPADCSAAGRGDWDCVCRSSDEWGTCTMGEVASMVLVGRVGEDGAPFIVGSGGVFTTAVDGELFLGVNDNTFTDNVGSFYAILTAFEFESE